MIRIAAAAVLVLGSVLVMVSCGNPLTWFLRNVSSLDMVYVEGGTMWLGDVDMVGTYPEESPTYHVQLPDFLMSRFEITQGQFEMVMSYNPAYFSPTQGYPYDENLPVERVTWLEAVKFCNALSEARGFVPCYTIDETPGAMRVQCDFAANGFRLPTESEWEYAARGGQWSLNTPYPGSIDYNQVAWHDGNSNGTTHPVGGLASNELGLYDMAGNVWEYVWDGWATDYGFYWADPYWWDSFSPILDPHGPFVLDNDRIWLDDNFALRGGGFILYGLPGQYERVSARTYVSNAGETVPYNTMVDPYWSYDTGFRIVRRP